MVLYTQGISRIYEIEALSRMLFHTISLGVNSTPSQGEDYIFATSTQTEDGYAITAEICLNGKSYKKQGFNREETEKQRNFAISKLLYFAAIDAGAPPLRWGILTGIRPINLFHRLAAQGHSKQAAIEYMQNRYLIGDEMAELCWQIKEREEKINQKSLPMGFSLYISIPFCPQRCSYCSFVSQTVDQQKDLIQPYVNRLAQEIADYGKTAKELGLVLQTVYFGGGTPTSLSHEQLAMLFETVAENFDLSNLLEYTVEAGRPDTITKEKLLAIKKAGVTRISINPQTMNDEILAKVGRKHSSKEVEDAFLLARSLGFDNINMDLIAGLPDETPETFEQSLKRVLALNPDNITVHTLTLKRSSTLVEAGEAQKEYKRCDDTAQMVDTARKLIIQQGFAPYYLYRQKNTVASLDNTGYCKEGKDGLYNVFIMDETHTILAAGAGAVTKLKAPFSNEIERIYNFKYPLEYTNNYHLLLERKERVKSFYENC